MPGPLARTETTARLSAVRFRHRPPCFLSGLRRRARPGRRGTRLLQWVLQVHRISQSDNKVFRQESIIALIHRGGSAIGGRDVHTALQHKKMSMPGEPEWRRLLSRTQTDLPD